MHFYVSMDASEQRKATFEISLNACEGKREGVLDRWFVSHLRTLTQER